MESLSAQKVGNVSSASPSQNTTGSRRADGQPEGNDLLKASTPAATGITRSEHAADEQRGVTSTQGGELRAGLVAASTVKGAHTDH